MLPEEFQTMTTPLECREDFIRDESGICVPSCSSWREFSDAEVVVTDVFIAVSAYIGFFSALAVLVISLFRFKRM